MRRISLALALIGAVAATGCGQTSKPGTTGGNRGIEGSTFKLTVRGEKRYETGSGASLKVYMLPEGGLVTGNGINCGYNASGVAQTVCEAPVVYGTPVALRIANFFGNDGAVPPVSYGFYGFAGACTGSGTATGTPACSIDAMNADRLVLVRFAFTQAGLGSHGPYQDGVVHGFAFATKALTCGTTQCHGTALQGSALAPSCASCHDGTTAFTITFPTAQANALPLGGHFDATLAPWGDHNGWGQDCLRCHTNQGMKDFVGADGTANYLDNVVATWGKTTQTLASTTAACTTTGTCDPLAYKYGPLMCDACHNSASEPTGAAGITTVTFNSFKQVTTDRKSAVCAQCHMGRESSRSLDAAIVANEAVADAGTLAFVNPHYLGAAATLFGATASGWAEYSGNTYTGAFGHVGLNQCTYCHDAHDGEIKVAAATCGGCHSKADGSPIATLADLELSTQVGFANDLDGDGTVETPKAEFEGVKAKLYAAIQAYAKDVLNRPILYTDGYPYFYFDANGNNSLDSGEVKYGNKMSARLARATFNYKWSMTEGAAWAHNLRYANEVLFDAIADLNAGLTAAGKTPVAFTGIRTFGAFALGGHFDTTGAMAGHNSGDCARCHNSDAFRDYTGADGSTANYLTIGYNSSATKRGTDLSTAFPTPGSFKCNACHNPTTEPIGGAGTWTRTKVFPLKTVTGLDPATALCAQCHDGARPGYEVSQLLLVSPDDAYTTAPDTQIAGTNNKVVRAHYLPSASTLFGSAAANWYQYPGKYYSGQNLHGGKGSCTSCHDPHTGQLPADTAIAAKCGVCHFDAAGLPVATFLALEDTRQYGFEGDMDGNLTEESLKVEIDAIGAKLYEAIRAYASNVSGAAVCIADNKAYLDNGTAGATANNGVCETGEIASANEYKKFTPRLLRAVYNYLLFQNDVGGWAHNPKYEIEILFDSIADLNAGLGANAVTFNGYRTFGGHFGAATAADKAGGMQFRDWDGGQVSANCSQCHAGQKGFVNYLNNPWTTTKNEPIVGMECSNCHVLNGTDMTGIVDITTFTGGTSVGGVVRFPPASTNGPSKKQEPITKALTDFGGNKADMVCATCHSGRESKASIDYKIASVTIDPTNAWTFSFVNPHYFGAAAVVFGADAASLYQYDGKTYDPAQTESCTSCHDPRASKHTFEAAPGNTVNRDNLAALASQLYGEITAYSQSAEAAAAGGAPVCYNAESHPYWYLDDGAGGGTAGNGICEPGETNGAKLDAKALKATFNFKWSQAEPGAYAHNYAYMGQILVDSILDLNPAATPAVTRP